MSGFYSKTRDSFISLLRWSEKYTKTDMIYLTKGGFWLTLGDIVHSGLAFLLAIVFARFLPKETFGTYQYALSVMGILSLFSLTGLGASLAKSVAQGKEGSFIPAAKLSAKWATLGGLAGIGVSLYYFSQGNPVLGWIFILVAAYMPVGDPLSLYQSVLEAKKEFKKANIYAIISNVVQIISLISAVILSKNILIILGAYILPKMVMPLIFFIKTAKEIPDTAEHDKNMARYGGHLTVLRFLGLIAEKLDTILLWNFLGAASVAIYSFALAPIDQIRGFLNNITVLAFPKLAQNSKEELGRTLLPKVLVMFLMMTAVTAVYILIAPIFYKFFFPQYAESIIYSQVFGLSILFLPRNIISEAMVAQGEKGKLYISGITTSIIRFPVMIILISMFGIWGAIYSYLITGIFSFILTIYLFKNKLKIFR